MRQEPRLQFTKEERADPALEKPVFLSPLTGR